jgi:hypothetical protein
MCYDNKPGATVQQLLQRHQHVMQSPVNLHVLRVLQRIRTCRTSVLGYHVYHCRDEGCGHVKYQYHSCRDRHCPGCGAIKKNEWIEARTQELLPVKYYHVVFTLPHELNSLVMGNRKVLFKLLFDSSAQTLLSFANDKQYLGATPGIISVLHTWGQQLSFHPHIHCIVSGGGIDDENKWKDAKRNMYGFLFPVKAMGIMYRGKFLEGLKRMIASGEVTLPSDSNLHELLKTLYSKDWVVYAKAPFGGPQAVIEYLGRYTHKVAISNHRIRNITPDGTVLFDYKDYADNNKKKQMQLKADEFIRRFAQHILPERFTKIRTYGYLANRSRRTRVNAVLKQLKLPLHKGLVKIPLQVRLLEKHGMDILSCPRCLKSSLQLVRIYYPWKNADDG